MPAWEVREWKDKHEKNAMHLPAVHCQGTE